MEYRTQLLNLVDLYRTSSRLSDARISTLIFNHGSRIKQIRSGAGFTIKSFEKAQIWFSEHWPDDLEWPKEIDRPNKPQNK